MTTTLSPLAVQQFLDANGVPRTGGKLFTYAAGTTTKLATYTDAGGGTPNTNPIVLDTLGDAKIWLPASVPYKYVLAPKTDTDPPTNPIWTVDNIVIGAQGFSGIAIAASGAIVPGNSYAVRTAMGAFSLTLGARSSTAVGQGVKLVDIDNDGAVNNTSILGTGGDQFKYFFTTASTFVMDLDGYDVEIYNDGSHWRVVAVKP